MSTGKIESLSKNYIVQNKTSNLTATSAIDGIGNTTCVQVGNIVICNINCNIKSGAATNAELISGFPTSGTQKNAYSVAMSVGGSCRLRLLSNGVLSVDGTPTSGYINATVVYTL